MSPAIQLTTEERLVRTEQEFNRLRLALSSPSPEVCLVIEEMEARHPEYIIARAVGAKFLEDAKVPPLLTTHRPIILTAQRWCEWQDENPRDYEEGSDEDNE